MPVRLTGSQVEQFVDALADAYNPNRFDQLLLGRLDKTRVRISMSEDYITILFAVVNAANDELWIMDLLRAARASRPTDPKLHAFEESLDFGSIPRADTRELERIVSERSIFHDVVEFRERFGELEVAVCAIEVPGGGGTGLLVARDVVLTNYHVIEPLLNGEVSASGARCRFDYKAIRVGAEVQEGRKVALAKNWDIAHSRYSESDLRADGAHWDAKELDIAFLRLAEPVGDEPIGARPDQGAPARSWVRLKSEPPQLVANDILFVLQHPQDLPPLSPKLRPMQLAMGKVTGFVGGGIRVRHDVRTLPGSSGSPCFDRNLELVAIHHAGDPDSSLGYKGKYNQAIPIAEVVRFLGKASELIEPA